MNLILIDQKDHLEASPKDHLEASPKDHLKASPKDHLEASPKEHCETLGDFRIADRRARHIHEILRAKIGDSLRVGLINGKVGCGIVQNLACDSNRQLFQVDLRCEFIQEPPPPPNIELWIALPRPKFLSKVVETATCFGIKQIKFFNASKVAKVYWSCDQLTPARLDEAMRLGLEQSGDTVMPVISFEKLFKPFIEDRAAKLIQNRMALVAHPAGDRPCPYHLSLPATVVIGPEGGFVPFEVEKFKTAGFECVDLFPRILKVETAVAAILGRLI